jgi:predicted Fe-S protein YdhL (DUF1289 family)
MGRLPLLFEEQRIIMMIRENISKRNAGKSLKEGHFSSEQWSDFVRGLGEPSDRKEIDKHLSSGCLNCKKENELWTSVYSSAQRQIHEALPERALQTAKANFRTSAAKPEIPGFFDAARVVFDSFRQPALAGVRSGVRTSRQLVYQHGDYYLDLRLEANPASERALLIGQVKDSSQPGKHLSESPVILLRGTDRVEITSTNAHGEFRLEFDDTGNLWLAVGIPGQAGIIMPLDRMLDSREQGRAN